MAIPAVDVPAVGTLRQTARRDFSEVFNFDIAGSAYGLSALGGAYANPTM